MINSREDTPLSISVVATRRSVLGGVLLLAGGAAVRVSSLRLPSVLVPGSPVVAYHPDHLYIARSPGAKAYQPPHGLRALEGHDAENLRYLVYGL